MANAWIIKPLAIAAATASTTALGAALNVNNDYAGVIWQSANGDTANILLDLGADTALNTIMAFGVQCAGAATVQVAVATAAQGTGFSGTNTSSGTGTNNFWGATQAVLAGSAIPVNGKYVMLWSAPSSAGPPAAVRYIKLSFSGLGAGAAVQLARVVAGQRIALTRNFAFGAGFGVRDLGSLDFSARGVLLRRRAAKLRTTALTFSNALKDEVEATVKPLLEQIGNTECVALVTDPDVNAQRMNRCYFGPLVGDLSVIWRNAAAWETKVNLVSLF